MAGLHCLDVNQSDGVTMKVESNAAAQYAALNSTPSASTQAPSTEPALLQEDVVSLSGANNNEQQDILGNGFGRMPPPNDEQHVLENGFGRVPPP